MKKTVFGLLLFSMLITSCAPGGMFAPTATATATVTLTPVPTKTMTVTPSLTPTMTPTDKPTLTPTPFPFSSLPGWFAYMDFDCNGLCTNLSIARPDNSGRRLLTNHDRGLVLEIYWSPDGRYIAFQFFILGEDGYVQLRLYDFQTEKETILTSQPMGNFTGISWSPDSRYLVMGYENLDGKHGKVQRLDVQSHGVINLTGDMALQNVVPAWSPAGGKITFSGRDADGVGHMWLMNANGANLEELFPEEGWHSLLPGWSPDGENLVFYRQDDADNTELWFMEADGSNARQLIALGEAVVLETPVWSPNGQFIGFIFGDETVTNVWILENEPGFVHIFSGQTGKFRRLSWSPDSRALIFLEDMADSHKAIHLYVPDAEHPFTVSGDAYMDFTTWSPVVEVP